MLPAMGAWRVLWGAILALALAVSLAVSPAFAGAKRPVVVELFTSQGCSSCPPADALLARLAERKDVIALSLPITYWDMLGWKDTLGRDANTLRQKAYAAVMGRGGVYTPQMIIDGTSDVVGSRESEADLAIAAREADAPFVPIDVRVTRSEIHIGVGTGDNLPSSNATIWLFHVLSKAIVAVDGGENAGHILAYRNVVRDIRAVGLWKGLPVQLDLPREQLTAQTHDEIAIVVQQNGYGRVLGAALVAHPQYFALH